MEELRKHGIPIIDVASEEEAIETVEHVLLQWEMMGEMIARDATDKLKLILMKEVDDWVSPYSNQGRTIPVVILSTHPEYNFAERMNFGFIEIALEEGFLLILISKDGKAVIPIEDYVENHKKWVAERFKFE